MSDPSQNTFRNPWLRELRRRIDSLFANNDSPEFFDGLSIVSPDVRQIVDTQLAIDFLTDENYRETMGKIMAGDVLAKRVTSETYDYLVRQGIPCPDIMTGQLEDIELNEPGKTLGDPADSVMRGPREVIVPVYVARSCQHMETFRRDDIKEFMGVILARPVFDFREDIGEGVTLLDAAGLAGAPKIFRYLLANNCPDSRHTEMLCVAGGNSEVIHMLEHIRQKRFECEACTTAAVIFHRHHILHWLAGRGSDIACTGHVAIEARNIYAFLTALKISRTISFRDIGLSLRSGCTGILKILCDLFAGILMEVPYSLSDDCDVINQDDRIEEIWQALADTGNHVSIPIVTRGFPEVDTVNLPFATSRAGNVEGLRYFLRNGLSANARSPAGIHLLQYGVMSGDLGTVSLLLARGADPRVRDKSGRGCLYYCAMFPADTDCIARLLYSLGARESPGVQREMEWPLSRLRDTHPVNEFFTHIKRDDGE